MLKDIIINKAGFPFYTDYWDKYFNKLSGDQVKECLKIIFHYNKTGEILETDDLAIEMVISTIIDNINRDAEKREKQRKASAENGKLGGRPKKGDQTPKTPKTFKKPTLEQVKEYNQSRGGYVDANKFYDYYNAGNWKDQSGNKVKNWKQKFITWENKVNKNNTESNREQHTVDLINKMMNDTLINKIEVTRSNKAKLFMTKDNFYKYNSFSNDFKEKILNSLKKELGVNGLEYNF